MTEPDTPRLSVVIAAYNAEATLGAQLAALVAQRPAFPWEIIVADNGSTDDTAAICAREAARHPEIRVVDASARRGPAAARNLGVAASRGSWIAFCDADDLVGDGWVEAVASHLATRPFVAGRFDLDRLRDRSPFSVSWSAQLTGLTTLPYLPGFVTAGAGNLALHRTVWDAVGGFDESALTGEDDDLCLRAQLAGFALTFAPDMLLHVRQRAGLRAVARQAYAYGAGARRLEHRYARVAADAPAAPVASSVTGAAVAPSAPVAAARPTTRRLGALVDLRRTPSRLANRVWRVAWRRGWARARLDDVVQIAPGTTR